MSYANLIEGEGYLGAFREPAKRSATRLAAAENAATIFIDGEFASWERTAWNGSLVPPEIRDLATKYGSAHYITQSILATAPQADRSQDLGQSEIRRQAIDGADRIKSRGYLLGTDGERLMPMPAEADLTERMVRVVR